LAELRKQISSHSWWEQFGETISNVLWLCLAPPPRRT
jgi:hypothetical protein